MIFNANDIRRTWTSWSKDFEFLIDLTLATCFGGGQPKTRGGRWDGTSAFASASWGCVVPQFFVCLLSETGKRDVRRGRFFVSPFFLLLLSLSLSLLLLLLLSLLAQTKTATPKTLRFQVLYCGSVRTLGLFLVEFPCVFC